MWKRSLSPGLRSTWRRCSLRCSSSVPPAPCTMPLGAPVVPDEKRVKRGWLNGNRGQSPPPSSASSRAHSSASRSMGSGVWRGSAPSSSAIAAISDGSPRMSSPIRSESAVEAVSPPSTRFAIRILGASCPKRLRSAGTPMSGEALEKAAPTAVVASPPTSTSMLLPATATTLSPGTTPRRRSCHASLRTRPRSSARLIDSRGPVGVVRHHRHVLVPGSGLGAEQVLRVAQADIREEAGELHAFVRAGRLGRSLVDELRPLEEERPEPRVLGHRERVECRVVWKALPGPRLAELGEGGELRLHVRGRWPGPAGSASPCAGSRAAISGGRRPRRSPRRGPGPRASRGPRHPRRARRSGAGRRPPSP